MLKKVTLFLMADIIAVSLAFSQGTAINSTGAKAGSPAILDLSSTTKDMLAPGMTQAQKNSISSPDTSLIIYQTYGTFPGYYLNTGITAAAPVWSFLTVSTQVQNNSLNYAAASGAANTYDVTLAPPPASYIAGMIVYFKANAASSGAAVLNVNGPGAVAVKKQVSANLAANDILASQLVSVIYNGTNFQMPGQPGNIAGATTCPAAGTDETLLIHNGCLYVKNTDETPANSFTWVSAQTKCTSIGSGWYLPDKDEPDIIYRNYNQPANGGKCRRGTCPLPGFGSNLLFRSSTACNSADAWRQYLQTTNRLEALKPILLMFVV